LGDHIPWKVPNQQQQGREGGQLELESTEGELARSKGRKKNVQIQDAALTGVSDPRAGVADFLEEKREKEAGGEEKV